jgi:hypothetical protein
MKKLACSLVALAFVLLLGVPAALAGPKLEFGEGGSLSLGVLGQVQGSWTDGAADPFDIFLRRGRLIFNGQIADGIKVFAETDFPNAGRTGSTASFILQDAFADVTVYGPHGVQVGLEILPFSFENGSSAASLLGLDYNAECIKFTNALNFRDLGAIAHGSFGTMVSYKVGVFDGYDNPNKNDEAALRFTGHVAVNVLGAAESGWFFNQTRLDQPTYLSLGAGFDSQADATVTTGPGPGPGLVRDADAWVADLQSGFKVGDLVHVTVNGAYYHWDSLAFKGNTSFIEAGCLAHNAMLTGKWSLQDPDKNDSVNDYTLGLNYFIKGQTLRAGLEYRWGDSPDAVLVGMQFLL